MSIDIFTRLRAFNELYYSVQIGKEFVLPPESREFIFKDDELWDHLGRLDEKLALERYGTSIEAGSPEELKRIATRYAQELREAKFLLDKFETDNEGVRGVFNRFSGGETCVALDEKIAEMEEDLMKAPEYIKLKAKNKELRRQLTELKQSAGSGPADKDLKVKIRRLEAELNQIKPQLDKYRARPAAQMDAETFNEIVAMGSKAEEAQAKAAEAEQARQAEAAARTALENEAGTLRTTLEKRETQYKSDLAAKDEQITAARKQVDAAEKETAAAKTEYEQKLAEQDETYKKKLAEKDEELAKHNSVLEEKIKSLSGEIEKAKKTLENRDETIRKTDEQLVELGKTADELKQKQEQMKSQFKREVQSAVAAKEAELKEQYGATTQEHVGSIQALEQDLAQKQGTINEYEGKIAQLEHTAQARELKLKELEDELEEIKTDAAEASLTAAQVPELQKLIEQHEADLPGLREAAMQAEALQSTINQYETRIADLEPKAKAAVRLETENAQLKKQKEKDQEEISQKGKRVQDLVAQISALEEAAKITAAELEELRTKGHEGEDVVSKAKYDADIAAKDEELAATQRLVESTSGAVEKEYEQKLADKDLEHREALARQDQANAAVRSELNDEIEKLEEKLEAAEKASAVPEGMEVIPKEELTNLRKGVHPDGKMLVDDVDEKVANECMAQKDTIEQQQAKIAEQEEVINNQKGTIHRMGKDISTKALALETSNKAREELQAAFDKYQQEQGRNTIRFKTDEQETSKLFAALDELAKVYDFKLTSPDVDSSAEIRFVATPTVENYLALLEYVRGKRKEDVSAYDTQILGDVETIPETVDARSADTTIITVTEEPAPEPEAPKKSPSLDETVEATPSPESADSTARGPRYTPEPKLVQTVADKEQAWYQAISAVITGKDVKTIKRQVFQGFLASDVENKRVEAYIFGNLAEEAYKSGDLEASLELNKTAYEAGKIGLAEGSDYSEFDEAQQLKREQNIALITKEIIGNKAA